MKRKANNKINNTKTMEKKNISASITNEILKEYDNPNTINESISDDKWSHEGTVLVKAYNNYKGGDKLLAFDLDDTLISPQDKKKFGKNSNDWKFWTDKEKIDKKLKEYEEKGDVFAILSNQNGIEAAHTTEEIFTKKIDKIFEQINYPFIVIAAKSKDYYRKPSIGMIELLESKYNNEVKIDRSQSYYVGNAAGRKKGANYPKNDHSDSDYKMALNAGMKFYTPEEFFLGQKQTIPKIEQDLHKYDKNNNNHIKFDSKQEMIILVGSPGSGKSTYCENELVKKGYVRINQDTLKTEKKCIQKATEEISKGKSVVIDCTNPKKEKRAVYIKVAKDAKIKVRCFIMDVDKELAFHLNNLREIDTERKHYSEAVNKIPIHTFYKYYEEPEEKEGFDEVVKINFVPGPFMNEKEKAIFYMLS